MKRYNCTVGDKRGEFGECMEKKTDGPWVRFSDVEKYIASLEKEIIRLKGKKK